MRTLVRSGSNAGSFAGAAAKVLVTMQSFVTVLGQERGAREGKADAVPGLAVEKTDLTEILSRCAERHTHLLDVAGVSGTAGGVQQSLGSDPDAPKIWNSLIDVARRAGELNAGNGYLVHQRLAQVDHAIDALSRARTSLYTTGGITDCGSGASRSLAQG